MDKKDLEEIEKWKRNKMNYVETYGIDIFNKKGKSKKKKIVEKIINTIYKIVKGILILLCIAIVAITIFLIYFKWNEAYNKLHIDAIGTLEGMYKIKINVESKNLDENDNGLYICSLKDNSDIKFNIITLWGGMTEDYADRCQKYFFDNWKNSNKNLIKTVETYSENNMLKYEQYIEITGNNEDKAEEKINDENVDMDAEIENAVRLMYDFVETAGDKFSPDWELYLKLDTGGRIYPFGYSNVNLENSLNMAKNEYHKIIENTN